MSRSRRVAGRPIQPVTPGKPLIQIVIPYSTLIGADDQPAELVGHGPIPASLAREVAAEGVWRRLVTDPLSGTLLDYGRTTYHPPAGLADHVRARDVYCRFPGCRRRAADAELDHVIAWSDGGTTSENNLAALLHRPPPVEDPRRGLAGPGPPRRRPHLDHPDRAPAHHPAPRLPARTTRSAAVRMVRVGFGMPWPHTLYGAWLVLRANQLWAPVPDNDPDGARATMRRFYALVARTNGEAYDVDEAARLEVEWWRVHRHLQRDAPDEDRRTLDDALTALYAHVYGVAPETVRPAAEQRAEAARISDRWVDDGCDPESSALPVERALLVRSYAALLAGGAPLSGAGPARHRDRGPRPGRGDGPLGAVRVRHRAVPPRPVEDVGTRNNNRHSERPALGEASSPVRAGRSRTSPPGRGRARSRASGSRGNRCREPLRRAGAACPSAGGARSRRAPPRVAASGRGPVPGACAR